MEVLVLTVHQHVSVVGLCVFAPVCPRCVLLCCLICTIWSPRSSVAFSFPLAEEEPEVFPSATVSGDAVV